MYDVHTHLEQPHYSEDREDEISRLKERLKGVITCATHPNDFQLGLEMLRNNPDFIHLSMGVHPAYIEKIPDKEFDQALEFIQENKDKIVSVGESGTDYHWVKDSGLRKEQIERFIQTIDFARSIKKPLTIHCRNESGTRDASNDLVKILEDKNFNNVHWHLFQYKDHVQNVIDNGWKISVGPLILNSKTMVKIVNELPMESIMLETDSPYWGGGHRGTSLNIIKVAEKIAEVKGMSFDEVWRACGDNTIKFFGLEQSP